LQLQLQTVEHHGDHTGEHRPRRTLDAGCARSRWSAAAAGVATHLGYFIHGEHHNNGCTIIVFYAVAVLT